MRDLLYRRLTVGKVVSGRSVELARQLVEATRTSSLEHLDDHSVLTGRRTHDVDDRVVVAQLVSDVFFDRLQFGFLLRRVVAERVLRVLDGRQRSKAGLP